MPADYGATSTGVTVDGRPAPGTQVRPTAAGLVTTDRVAAALVLAALVYLMVIRKGFKSVLT